MKLPDSSIFKTLNEAIHVVTSRERLKHVLTTPLYSNALYLVLNTAIMTLAGFFFWLIVARFYDEAVVGYSSAIISALNLLALFSLVGLNTSMIRFLPRSERPTELINTCFTLCGVISLVAAGIFLAGLELWSPALGFIRQNIIFCLAFLVFAPLWTLSSLVNTAFIASRRSGYTLSKNTIFSLLKIPLPILFVLFFSAFGVVASWGIAIGVAVALSLFLFLPKVQNHYKPVPTLKLGLIKGKWQYSGGYYLSNLLLGAPSLILPLMVVNLLGAEDNAYFYVAWMIASSLFAIPGGVASSLFAEGSHFEDKLGENVIKSLKFTFLLLVPAVILLTLVAKWLLLAFGWSYSVNALKVLWILAISGLPLGINYIYSGILRVTGRLKELAVIWGFIAIAVLMVSFLIMPSNGIIGIGYAWLGAHVAVAIYILSARKLTKIHGGEGNE